MGMFDDVDYEMVCPICGEKINNFQTKSMINLMVTYKPTDLGKLATFYSWCETCGTKAEFIVKEWD